MPNPSCKISAEDQGQKKREGHAIEVVPAGPWASSAKAPGGPDRP